MIWAWPPSKVARQRAPGSRCPASPARASRLEGAWGRVCRGIWDEQPPASAVTNLHGYVSRLRKVLLPDALQTRPSSYLLQVEPELTDLQRFE
jgi:hypothetical protein